MTDSTDAQRAFNERLDRLASRYLVETARECLQVAVAVMVVTAAIGAFFTDFGNPAGVRVFAAVTGALGALCALGIWTGAPSRRLRQLRRSPSWTGRLIRAHVAGRTVGTRREIDGHRVYLTRELKEELKSRWWWQSDSRIDAVLDKAAEPAPLTPAAGLRWCVTKTFPADPDARFLYVRWSLPDFGRVIVIGRAAPLAGQEGVDEGFEDGYTPGRWLNRQRVGEGTAAVIGALLLVSFAVIVLPALLVIVGALVAVPLLLVLIDGGFKRKR
ncbi:hypothetical protein EF912_09740 [Streptomyces sp. WAC07061]|uniref:hypothetical protein n=1 Tax=Streptomyces sp. WAC07061 TaxID=2487410 RepID=UPI000F77233D|nr:hypothetical protein [Streptomyces sp. WAC07061]RSS60538.1 hypothetical protein EF912_09740 [Streptomyces sp. WAC07061]